MKASPPSLDQSRGLRGRDAKLGGQLSRPCAARIGEGPKGEIGGLLKS